MNILPEANDTCYMNMALFLYDQRGFNRRNVPYLFKKTRLLSHWKEISFAVAKNSR